MLFWHIFRINVNKLAHYLESSKKHSLVLTVNDVQTQLLTN
ncbi:hypothetical protein AsAng_0026380 [Aureispira anguillae]|uniref:Uncharacterized protein n=1 Tax=Aureispira anguillae TaxID=2864201 RepID=A0A915YF11_9BACT|nr:hypothetical protein AsAng_0026380 [Aureispira anguillae]